jgi:hypothetical protein
MAGAILLGGTLLGLEDALPQVYAATSGPSTSGPAGGDNYSTGRVRNSARLMGSWPVSPWTSGETPAISPAAMAV